MSIGLIAAGTWSWGHGLVAALLLVGVPWLPFRTDRRRWDRVVEASYADCLAQAEQILKGR